MTRFIHTSDWQLGKTWARLRPEAAARLAEARLEAIRTLGKLATEHGAEFIVVAGDVFEHNSLSRETLGRALEQLKALPVPVYLLPGNHDPLVADSIFYETQDIPGVHIVTDHTPIRVEGTSTPVEIVGAPLLTRHPDTDLVALALDALPDDPEHPARILLAHGQVLNRDSIDNPATIDLGLIEDALQRGVINYVAMGDTHSAQTIGHSGAVWYSGAPEPTDFFDTATGGGENNSGHALLVTLRDEGVDVEELSTGTWTMEAIEADVNSIDDVADFLARLDAYPNKSKTVIKYTLRGTIDLTAMNHLDAGLDARTPIFAALYPRERLMDLTLAPGTEELDTLQLGGYADGALRELLEASADGDTTAEDALRLLFRLQH